MGVLAKQIVEAPSFDKIDNTTEKTGKFLGREVRHYSANNSDKADTNQSEEPFFSSFIGKITNLFFTSIEHFLSNSKVQLAGCFLACYLTLKRVIPSIINSVLLFSALKTASFILGLSDSDYLNHSKPILGLPHFCEDLTDRAEQHPFSTFHGREQETEQLIQVLLKKEKNNAILVGPAGCGKTALVTHLAQKINEGEVPLELQGKKVISLDLLSLIADTKYRGEFKKRVETLLNYLRQDPERYILFIDEAHLIATAGEVKDKGTQTLANFLKPALAEGLCCIAATTPDEYIANLSQDGALIRRFETIEIKAMKTQAMELILNEIKGTRFEEKYNVTIDEEVLKYVVKKAHQLIPNVFPDAPISLLDNLCSYARLNNKERVTKADVDLTFSKMLHFEEYPLHPLALEPKVGVFNGLFATSIGFGGVMPIQITKMFAKNPFEIKITGLVGKTIVESVQIAKSLAWNLLPFHLRKQLFAKESYGFHLHFPPGADPKDGPSAGAAITCAMFSRLSNIPLRNDSAMTGEIDSLGNVTRIGGLKEKVQGAANIGIKYIFVPKSNEKDLKEVEEEISGIVTGVKEAKSLVTKDLDGSHEGVHIILVENIEDALPLILQEFPSHLSNVA